VLTVIWAVVFAFLVDQGTKVLAQASLADGQAIDFGLGVRLKLVYNPGVAFGLGGALVPPVVVGLVALSVALVAWAIVRSLKDGPLVGTIFLALAGGGALGNVWDRISRATDGPFSGRVVDFIAVDWFAVFNVADIFTTCGIAAWALTSLRRR
jgi:signal peptidase II